MVVLLVLLFLLLICFWAETTTDDGNDDRRTRNVDLDLSDISPENKMSSFRGYEDPSDFSLERSGCLLQPFVRRRQNIKTCNRGPDDDFDDDSES